MQACLQEKGGKDKEDNAAITVRRRRRVGRKEESPAFLRVPRLNPVVVGTLQPPLPPPLPVAFKKAPACLSLPADSGCFIYTAVQLTL
ncbi:hypothetical protein BHE74_00019981 [Ensete ventricosum]|nr:hypothetical protein BHE74_00019981 [Ensete ventricosum]RZS27130.1 hypothetical protein BHM03_00060560 [Ensete ventricosum]